MTSHDRVCIIEVMGRRCGDIALYSAVAGGAEGIIVPEKDFDVEKMCQRIKVNREKGKNSEIIVLAVGVMKAEELKARMKLFLDVSIRTMTLGHIQRGGSPTGRDRILAARMGVKAVELLKEGQTNRVVGIRNEKIVDMDISEALEMESTFDGELYRIARILSY